jgi:hypothetical protein
MRPPTYGPSQAAAYEEARKTQAIQDLIEQLRRYVHCDETAGNTDNNLYRTSKALIEKLGEPS